MWSRAKRIGKGERLDQGVWVAVSGVDEETSMSESGVSEVNSDEDEVREGMEHAVERAYGSDREEGEKNKVE